MVKLKNVWWRDSGSCVGPGKFFSNFFKRFFYAIFCIFRTLKSPTVIIALGLGILLLFLGTWLRETTDTQEAKVKKPIIQVDDFIDDVLNGINFLTQDVPVQAYALAYDAINKTENSVENIFQTFFDTIEATYTVLALNTIQPAINRCMQALSQPYSVSFPGSIFVVARSTFSSTSWLPAETYNNTMNELEDALFTVKIPQFVIDWSMLEELEPFLDDIFHIPRVIATYCNIIGAILIAYAGIRLGISFFAPFIPRIAPEDSAGGKCCAVCVHMVTACGKGTVAAGGQLFKPWIHIPLIIGILMIAVVLLYIFVAIKEVDKGIRVPLQKADGFILEIIQKMNNFTHTVPPKVITIINTKVSAAQSDAYQGFQDVVLSNLLTPVNSVFRSITTNINSQVLTRLPGSPQLTVTNLSPGQIGINSNSPIWQRGFMPIIPPFLFDALLVKEDIISLEREIVPWVDDRMQELKTFAMILLWIGLVLAGLPLLIICYSFWKPCVPKKARHYLSHPDFLDEINEAPPSKDQEMEQQATHPPY